VILILAVDLSAIGVVITSTGPLHRSQLGIAALLASLSIAYSRCTVGWERARRAITQERHPTLCPNLLATWAFAAALLLPLPLAAAVIVAAAVAEWPARNIAGQATPYRYVYSTAGAILAASAAHRCMTLHLSRPFTLALAGASYMLVGIVTVALAMMSVGQFKALTMMVRPETHHHLEHSAGLVVTACSDCHPAHGRQIGSRHQ
jgi:hypothetical protein